MPDVYDREIAYLAEHPECLCSHWKDGTALFSYCTPSRQGEENHNGNSCGCPVLVRAAKVWRGGEAWTDELTREIQADARIPDHFRTFERRVETMTPAERVAALEPFAEWQRRLDRELDRQVPERFPGEPVTAN